MKSTKPKNILGIISFLMLFLGFQVAYAAYDRYGVGDTVTVGEFVYEDDFTPSTVDCTVSIYDPSGATMVNAAVTTKVASGWHYYTYTVPGTGPNGTWPASISCGTLIGGDLVTMDKTFSVGATIESASSSLSSTINANTNAQTSGITSAVNANTNSVVATASSSLFASLPGAVWTYTSRTLSSFGTLVADVWGNSVRTLTGASLNTGTLATASDVTSAANSASSSVVALVNANTNTQTASVITAVQSASSSLSSQILANRSLISALNNISANDVWAAGTRTLTDYATSSIASSASDAVWNKTASQLTTIGSIGRLLADNIDATISSRGTSNLTAADVWAAGTRTLSDYNTAGISSAAATAVWENATRSLTNYGNNLTAAEVWSTLTSSMTSIGSIGKLLSDNVDVPVSSRASLVNQTASWKITMSDISAVQTGKTYRARIEILNNNSIATTPYSAPTVTLYDADRNVVASNVAMTALSTGIYEYTYAVSSGASQGVWETVINTQVESGKTLSNNDYWLVSGSPAQVIINSVTASSTSDISANVTITNEGLAGYEYHYEWCVVSNINNACGGGDDAYHGTGAKFINPSEDWNTNLTASVATGGNYYFKLVVYFGTEKSGSSRTFSLPVTEVPPSGGGSGGGSSGGGGGGGSSGGSSNINTQTTTTGPGIGADISGDHKVNSIDFSILLAFWKTPYPFANKAVDLNGDHKVNSIDFSILLSQWGTTGKAL